MKKLRIIADDKIPFLKGALDGIADIMYLPGAGITAEHVKNADAMLIRTRTKCNAELLHGSSVKFIATATIGFDHIDTEYCENNGIYWTNAPGCNSSSVEQYVVSVLLNLAYERNIKLSGLTMAVIGVGNVGKKVARAAKALGLIVLQNDPPRAFEEGISGFDSLERIKKEADIISFHVPLNTDGPFKTVDLGNKEFFEGLCKKPILINSSRGEVLNENDLLLAINKSLFEAVILDVWHNEPSINTELLNKIEIATPHIAGYSTDGKANGTQMSVQALSRFFNLGLDNWFPLGVPLPENIILTIDCTRKTEIQIMHEVYSQIYDVRIDDALLRSDIEGFEDQRGKYRLRREAKIYSVKLINNSLPEVEEKLEKLGFAILEPNCFCEI